MIQRVSTGILSWMVFGFAFLYAPIITLITYSFNKGKTGLEWSGFTWHWYQKLLHNPQVLEAAFLSLKIATLSATTAVLIGTIGAIVIVRFQAFKGRSFFNLIVTAPLVMPDVMTGLALLLLFVSLDSLCGWPGPRGMTTITIGHITISIAYVLIIIRTRLSDFDTQLEQAAMDLGARPLKAFISITLPYILPSIGAGWLLAFTLSLDDVILASFLSGPGSTTLPMYVFSSIRFGVNPEINALASIIVFLVAFGVMISGIIIYRRSRRQRI